MRVQVDVLGWLHQVWGAFGVLAGTSLGLLAVGTEAAARTVGAVESPVRAAVWILAGCALALASFGGSMLIVGRAVRRRRGRTAALLLALPNLVAVPFGTALGLYTFWVLQNDDARAEFSGTAPGTDSPAGGQEAPR